MVVKNLSPNDLIPYKKNAKRHSQEQIDNVAASISAFGFVQPVVVDKDNVIVIGHSRTLAAKQLGLEKIPVVTVDSLSEEEVKALRIADNKLNESTWDKDLLERELESIQWEDFDLEFDFSGDTRRKESWHNLEKKCNLKKQIAQLEKTGMIYTSFYKTTKDGIPLEDIKEDRENVQIFSDNLVDYILKCIGRVGKTWCLMTTPRRRNKDFHFATAVCEVASKDLGIPFYKDAVTAVNRKRIEPVFIKNADPREDNIILYDDIITTGSTMLNTREMFVNEHSVFPIIAIRNR